MTGPTVFSMQVSDLEGVFAPFHDVVVPLEQIRRRSQFRSWKLRNRAQVQPVSSKAGEVEEGDNEKSNYENGAAAVKDDGVQHRGLTVAGSPATSCKEVLRSRC